ncbi:MAG: HAD-IG family 5'-nucleotidase, partial [Myxococcales bacterium]|nr:HAD-IG family 5'-nucleotidase [Myxococcales bacterium]
MTVAPFQLSAQIPPERGIFCNRTLNMRSIKAIGYDMDYTLVHYKVATWEERAYSYLRENLEENGWPVADLAFQPRFIMRGLVIDLELGNIVKANRFGYIKHAYHGTRLMSFEDQRKAYARTLVDLSDSRWVFLNTFFSLSEACMYAQLVDLLDDGKLEAGIAYRDLHEVVRIGLDSAHAEGRLKAEIIADPGKFVELDEETPQTLLDQKDSGKRLLLITNSEWHYTQAMMEYCFDRFLPDGMGWRDLFELV